MFQLDYDGYDAFAINPLSSKCTAFVDAIADSGKPVALFNNDLPSSRRLFYVGTDNSQCGRIAGEIMGLIMQGEGAVTVLGNFVHIMPFYERYEGFCEVIHDYYPNIDIFPSSDSRYEQDLVEKNIDKLLASGAKKFGIFSTGRNSTGALTWGFNPTNVGNMLFRAMPVIMTGLSVAFAFTTFTISPASTSSCVTS